MKMNYNIEQSLDWQDSQKMILQPPGWKQIVIEYIDSPPYIFWKLENIDGSFRSKQRDVIEDGAAIHFTKVLMQLKETVLVELDKMNADRKAFYEDNFLRLFR